MKNQLPKVSAPIILFLFVMAFIINSCKKELSVSQTVPLTQKQQADVVNEAKTWFQKTKPLINHPPPLMKQAVPASGMMA